MTKEELQAIRQRCAAASPGEWTYVHSDKLWIVIGKPDEGIAVIPNDGLNTEVEKRKIANAAYISAVNPAVMLQVLDYIDKLEFALEDAINAPKGILRDSYFSAVGRRY